MLGEKSMVHAKHPTRWGRAHLLMLGSRVRRTFVGELWIVVLHLERQIRLSKLWEHIYGSKPPWEVEMDNIDDEIRFY